MDAPSPLNRCLMVLCYAAAGLLAAGAWRDQVSARWQFDQPFERLRFARLAPIITQAPETLMTANTRVVISLRRRRLTLYQNDVVKEEFPVAIGQNEWQTPAGEFAVRDLRTDPVWQHPITKEAVEPGPSNPLGSRWIGFLVQGQYHIGIHGTNQENLIGEAVSHGCVRMFEADIQTLYRHLKIGTPITVLP
ncbi:L,D-transpeptidase [Nodosilinea sp. E11]|uniref:L,D-transpeptidase n=1 Tax=Nodosilinea sp. E11 TaxID=3037479 RepID=UPI00293522C9|nr:L,D-transpeptidase [Nodosilinea sp. E11]WOD38600.1 L,D-transpeptidase [Nodosilinea sp. E11]